MVAGAEQVARLLAWRSAQQGSTGAGSDKAY